LSYVFLSAVSLLASGHASAGNAPAAVPMVIINARIETSPGVVIERGGIKIKDGKIEAVGSDVGATGGYETVDAKGGWVFPGFIEAYTRDGLKLPETPKAPDPPAAQNDALYQMFHGNRRGIYPTLDASKIFDPKGVDVRYFAQGVTTVHVASGRGAFGGQSAVFNLTAMNGLLKAGATQTVAIATGPGEGYPTSPMGNYAVVRQFLSNGKFASTEPSTDADEQAMAATFKSKQTLLIAGSAERQIDRVIKLSDEFGLPAILLGGRDADIRAADLKQRNIAVLLDLSSPDEPKKTQSTEPEQKLSDPPTEYLNDRYARWVEGNRYASRIQASGVPFAFYADGAKGKFLELLRTQITNGLSREAALAAVTVNSAKILGLDTQLGSIATGKIANLAIFPGDFTVANSKPTIVIVAGEKNEVKA